MGFPITLCQLCQRAERRVLNAVGATFVLAFAIGRLRAGDDDLFHGQLFLDDDFVQQRGADSVDVKKLAKVGQIVLVRRQVKYRVDSDQRALPCRAVTHVAQHKLRLARYIVRHLAFQVDWRREAVQDTDLVSLLQQ